MPHIILRPYALGFKNRLGSRSTEIQRRHLRVMLLIAPVVMTTIFLAFISLFKFMSGYPMYFDLLPRKIIELISYSFFILLLLSNTISVTGNVFSSHSMTLLLTAPISRPRLYFAKLIETMVETSIMGIVFILPVIASYLYYFSFPGKLLLSVIVIAPFFLVIPVGLAFVLSTAFIGVASVIWKRGYFLVLCCFAVVGIIISKLFLYLSQVQSERGSDQAIIELVGLNKNTSPFWLPSRWTSDIILSSFVNINAPVKLEMLLLIATAFGVVALGYIVFDCFVLLARARHAADDHSDRKLAVKTVDPTRRLLEKIYCNLPINSQVRAIILKDLTALVRDRTHALQLLLYLGITSVYLVIVKFLSTAVQVVPTGQRFWWACLISVNFLFCGFILAAVITRLVYPAISLEGRAFWLIIVAPINFTRLIFAKFLCWVPLSIMITVTLLVSGVFAVSPSWGIIIVSVFSGACLAIGCTGIAIGVGALFANFEWESPNQISASLGTLVLLLSGIALVVICFPLVAGLTFLTVVPEIRSILGPAKSTLAIIFISLIIFIINFLVARFSIKRGSLLLKSRHADFVLQG